MTYTHKPSNAAQVVTGVITRPGLDESYPGGTTFVEILFSDLSPAPVQGDSVTIGTNTYTVADVKADPIGPTGLFARLTLRKVA